MQRPSKVRRAQEPVQESHEDIASAHSMAEETMHWWEWCLERVGFIFFKVMQFVASTIFRFVGVIKDTPLPEVLYANMLDSTVLAKQTLLSKEPQVPTYDINDFIKDELLKWNTQKGVRPKKEKTKFFKVDITKYIVVLKPIHAHTLTIPRQQWMKEKESILTITKTTFDARETVRLLWRISLEYQQQLALIHALQEAHPLPSQPDYIVFTVPKYLEQAVPLRSFLFSRNYFEEGRKNLIRHVAARTDFEAMVKELWHQSFEYGAYELLRRLFEAAKGTKSKGTVTFIIPSLLEKLLGKDLPLKEFTLPEKLFTRYEQELKKPSFAYDKTADFVQSLWRKSFEAERRNQLFSRKIRLLPALHSTVGQIALINSITTLSHEIHRLVDISSQNAPYGENEQSAIEAARRRAEYSGTADRLHSYALALVTEAEGQTEHFLANWKNLDESITSKLDAFQLEEAAKSIEEAEKELGISEKLQAKALPDLGIIPPSLTEKMKLLHESVKRLSDIKEALQIQVKEEAFLLQDRQLSQAQIEAEQQKALAQQEKDRLAEEVRLKQQAELALERAKAYERRIRMEQQKQGDLHPLVPVTTAPDEELRSGYLLADAEEIKASPHIKLAASLIVTMQQMRTVPAAHEVERLLLRNALLKATAQLFNALLSCPPSFGIREIISFVEVNKIRQKHFHLDKRLLAAPDEEVIAMAGFIVNTFGPAIIKLAETGLLPEKSLNPDYSKCPLFTHLRQMTKDNGVPAVADCIKGMIKGLEALHTALHAKAHIFSKVEEKLQETIFKDGSDMITACIGEYARQIHLQEAMMQQQGSAYGPLYSPSIPPIIESVITTVRREVHHPLQDVRKGYSPHNREYNASVKEEVIHNAGYYANQLKEAFKYMLAIDVNKQDVPAVSAV